LSVNPTSVTVHGKPTAAAVSAEEARLTRHRTKLSSALLPLLLLLEDAATYLPV